MTQHDGRIGTRKDLVLYRLQTAEDALRSAKILFCIGKVFLLTKSLSRVKILNHKEKPLRKSSRHPDEITESRRGWDCGMESFAEWTFEDRLKSVFQGE